MNREIRAASAVVAVLMAWAPVPARGGSSEPRTRNVAIVVYPGVEVLDFAGPGEVFQAAAHFAGILERPAFRTYTVATTKEPIVSQGFVRVVPEYSIEDAPKPDILVLPGGSAGQLTSDPRFMSWAEKAIHDSEVTLTVCTGAFVAAKAGVLDGHTATTWYGAVEALRSSAPKAAIEEGRRFVDSGQVVTTAGVSAGIDGALHVVARLLGRSAADRTARYMEYHWAPEPYLALHYAQLNPDLDEAGHRIEQALIREYDKDFEGAVLAWRSALAKSPTDAAWYRLGFALHSLGRYDEAVEAAAHVADSATASAPDRSKALYNIACARARQGQKDEAIAALQKAVQAGYDASRLRDGDSDLDSIRSDRRFEALLTRTSR